jgi:protein SCO1/2
MTRTETIVWGIVALALAAVIALAVGARVGREAPPAPAPAPTPEEPMEVVQLGGEAPEKKSELLPASPGDFGDVPCTERSGRAMRTSDLKGRFVVADFIFTYCGGPCPAMSGRMNALAEATKAAKDLVLVTFTVDPDKDTPAELAKYADRFGADKERWLFLHCERPALQEIAYDHLKIVTDRNDLFTHSTQFVVADRTGRIRAYYSPLSDKKWLEKLQADLDILRGEPAK